MAYIAPGPQDFRQRGGDLDLKLCGEFEDIQDETDALAEDLAEGLAGALKIAVVDLAGGVADAFAFAWENPAEGALYIERVAVNVETAGGTATAVLNVGTANTATTGSDNLIDGMDANATGLTDNITGAGTNGKSGQVLAAGKFITGQIKTEAAAGLEGQAIIIYGLLG